MSYFCPNGSILWMPRFCQAQKARDDRALFELDNFIYIDFFVNIDTFAVLWYYYSMDEKKRGRPKKNRWGELSRETRATILSAFMEVEGSPRAFTRLWADETIARAIGFPHTNKEEPIYVEIVYTA